MVPIQTPHLKIGCVATATNDDFVIEIDAITDQSTCWQINSFCKPINIEQNKYQRFTKIHSQAPVDFRAKLCINISANV